ncbi:helix-turn-helix transcriptional regulator [Pluralibacter sp.]|jgi:DNA-binding CsgD family transcriptional regulator|uniref:helix-turn-helix domain-containing protein n=1 Tax=Pluralibacter sp. TaxID=1920032 RepID=UPI0025D9C1F4|nr:helix-turn-helix transcriptional regulator [Pluralibacter sp.]MBV8042594.1 helix-turn-helix transcriptional regulator [Pluralibacter sp.]
MISLDSFIYCKDQFFATGLAEVIPNGLAQGTFTFFDNEYILEYGARESIHATPTQPIIFIDNDLDYYALQILTKDSNLLLISKKCKLSEILTSLLLFKKKDAYKVGLSLSQSELQVLECLIRGATIEQMVATLKRNEKTIYAHRNAIIKKLNLKNRNALYRLKTWADIFK